MTLNRSRVASVLEWGSFLMALAAAGWWFASATIHLPAPVPYWDKSPENDPFISALKYSANLNGIAAFLTGISVLMTAVARLIRNSIGSVSPLPAERRTL